MAATNLSCDTLSIKGNPVSEVLQNVIATPGSTTFTGTVTADTLISNGNTTTATLTATGAATLAALTAGTITSTGSVSANSIGVTGAVTGASVTATGAVTGTTLVGTISTPGQFNITNVGTLTSLNVSGGATVGSLSTAGNITQTSTTTASLQNVTIANTKKLAFTTGTLQQKIDLYGTGTYGVGVSTNQLNLVAPAGASLVFYNGGTNNDGTERFRVDSTGLITTPAGFGLMTGGTTVTAASQDFINLPVPNNYLKVRFNKLTVSATHQFYLAASGGTPVGSTYGSNGATSVDWGGTTIYLKNTTTISIPTSETMTGWIEIQKVTATTFQVTSWVSFAGASNYWAIGSGMLTTKPTSLQLLTSSSYINGQTVSYSTF